MDSSLSHTDFVSLLESNPELSIWGCKQSSEPFAPITASVKNEWVAEIWQHRFMLLINWSYTHLHALLCKIYIYVVFRITQTQRSLTTRSHLSGMGLSVLGSRRQSIRQVQISSAPVQVWDAPLLLGAGQGWAQTAGTDRRLSHDQHRLDWEMHGLDPNWVRLSLGDFRALETGRSPETWAVNFNLVIPHIFGGVQTGWLGAEV